MKVTIETKKDTQDKLALVNTRGSVYFILAKEFNDIIKAINTTDDELKAIKAVTPTELQEALTAQLQTISTALLGNPRVTLEALVTENKQNLIVAINEVNSLVKAVDLTHLINDELEEGAKNTWSIDKINTSISERLQGVINDAVASSATQTYSIDKINALLSAIDFTTLINDEANSSIDKVWSIDAVKTFVTQQIEALIGTAPEGLNTLQEIATELQENDTLLAQILAAQAKRVRVDAEQDFTEAEKAQGRANIDVYSTAEVNDKISGVNSTITQQRSEINNELADLNTAISSKVSSADLEATEVALRGEMNVLKSKFFKVYKMGVTLFSKLTAPQDYGFGAYQYKQVVIVPVTGISDGEKVEVSFKSTSSNTSKFYQYNEKREVTVINKLIIFNMYTNSATVSMNDTLTVSYSGGEQTTSVQAYDVSRTGKSPAVDFTTYTEPSSYTIGTYFKDLKTKNFVVAGKAYNNAAYHSFTPEKFTAQGLNLGYMWTFMLLGEANASCDFGKHNYTLMMEAEAHDVARVPNFVFLKYNPHAYVEQMNSIGLSTTYDTCVFSETSPSSLEVEKAGCNYMSHFNNTFNYTGVIQPVVDFSGASTEKVSKGSENVVNLNLQGERSVNYTVIFHNGMTVVLNGKKEDVNIIDRLDFMHLPLDLEQELKEQYYATYQEGYEPLYTGLNVSYGYLKNIFYYV